MAERAGAACGIRGTARRADEQRRSPPAWRTLAHAALIDALLPNEDDAQRLAQHVTMKLQLQHRIAQQGIPPNA